MRKIITFALLLILINSCATYKVQKSHSSGGYPSWHGKHKKKYEKSSFTN